jgi:cofilin
MADAASTLRTARAALQEGLITEGDYEAVKAAFLKAQQFKAGLDAGFISEADYAEVKTRFLDAFYGLNVADTNGGGGSGGATPQQSASPAVGQPSGMAGETRNSTQAGGKYTQCRMKGCS